MSEINNKKIVDYLKNKKRFYCVKYDEKINKFVYHGVIWSKWKIINDKLINKVSQDISNPKNYTSFKKTKIKLFFKKIGELFLSIKNHPTNLLLIISFILGIIFTVIFLSYFYGIGENGKYNKVESRIWAIQSGQCSIQYEMLNKKQEYLIEAMTETKRNIDSANENIEDARKTAWENYDEMGNALENLNKIDFVEIYNIY